jgi:sepiapterin reductase
MVSLQDSQSPSSSHYEKTAPIILITGAGKGIGEAVVRGLIRMKDAFQEPKLILTARTAADLDRLKKECADAGVSCDAVAMDLVDSPTATVELALQKYGRINILIHSAGVGRFDDFLTLTADDLTFVMRTNVEASFLLMQKTYAQMQKQKFGDIVWITSVAAEKPFEQSAIYCMSKYAQKGLIDVMRLYGYKDHVRIVEVKPGATFTPMWGEIPADMKSRMMEASDIASPILNALLLPFRASVEEILIRPVAGDI